MAILGDLAPRTFIECCWQKEALLVRGALESTFGVVDGDTLAGLACEPDVESRIVITGAGANNWRCEHGPFDEERFTQLPASSWTLLVQAVDQWIPEVAALLEQFEFLPRWRIDDIMVSYATDGGGVGPHFDHYDVFLLQLEGTRRWQVGQRCDAHSPLRDHPDLKLLQAFDSREDWNLDPGDMLYLPPGLAHWGTAVGENCVTCSIGFRAPSRAEIIQGTVDQILSKLDEHQRFVDVPASVDRDPYCINDDAVESARALWPRESVMDSADALAVAFGQLVTEPRTPSLIEPDDSVDAKSLMTQCARDAPLAFEHHPASRFAYRLSGDTAVLFVDGDAHLTSASTAKGICHGHLEPGDIANESTRALLARLFQSGSLRAL